MLSRYPAMAQHSYLTGVWMLFAQWQCAGGQRLCDFAGGGYDAASWHIPAHRVTASRCDAVTERA